jgi:hypothetical protein
MRRTCGHRYHDLTGASTTSKRKCWCSTYAVCDCATCGSALCGDHRYWRNERWRCESCATAIDAQAVEVEKDAERVAAAVEARRLIRLEAIGDPVERLLRGVAGRSPTNDLYDMRAEMVEVVALVPDEIAVGVGDARTWNSVTVAKWFARRAAGSVPFDCSVQVQRVKQSLLSGRSRSTPSGMKGGWYFARGGDGGGYGIKDLVIMEDGRTTDGHSGSSVFSFGGGMFDGMPIGRIGLIKMAERLDLRVEV